MEAYCVKCKTKREVQEAQAEFNATGAPVTRGRCGVCGTTLYRIGRTPAHEGMEAPQRKAVRKRSGKLVIVESPAKAKKIAGFLGDGWRVEACLGHVRDLPPDRLGIAVDDDFRAQYAVLPGKKRVIERLTRA